jgi:hypothetical protein
MLLYLQASKAVEASEIDGVSAGPVINASGFTHIEYEMPTKERTTSLAG